MAVFNGVILPDIPEGFFDTNQYGFITEQTFLDDGTVFYQLCAFSSPAVCIPMAMVQEMFGDPSITVDLVISQDLSYQQCYAVAGSTTWGTPETVEESASAMVGTYSGMMHTNIIWCNHDILTATAVNEETFEITTGTEVYLANGECIITTPGGGPVEELPERYSIARTLLVGYADQARRLSGTTEKMDPERIRAVLEEVSKGTKTSWIAEIDYSYITDSEGNISQKMTSQTNNIHLPSPFYFSPSATSLYPITAADFPVAKTMDCAFFKNYTGLITANLPLLTELAASAFYGCTGLTEVNIPCVEAVPDRAFYGCAALANVNMPAAKTIGEYTFANGGCDSLVDFDFTNIESIGGHGFYGSPYTELVLPATVTIGEDAFGQSMSLTSVNLPVAKTIGESAFSGCTNLARVDLGAAEEVGIAAFWSANMGLETVVIRTNKVCQLAEMREGKENIDVHFGNSSHHYYIYVPAALIDAYKADATWASYPAHKFRTIEDYHDICGTMV